MKIRENFCSETGSLYQEGNEWCENSVNCECYWNETINGCRSKWEETKHCWNGEDVNITIEECIYSDETRFESDQEGCYKISWDAVWTGSDDSIWKSDCKGGEEEICIAKLVFFTLTSLILSILIITLIYFLIHKKKLQ